MHSRLYNYFDNFEVLFHRYFGFWKNFAKVYPLAEKKTELLRLGIDKNIKRSFFSDFKNALDTLDQAILLGKLECYGLRGNSYSWFESCCLTDLKL